MTDFYDIHYNEVCAECDSWNLRLTDQEYNKFLGRWEFWVYCRDCGHEVWDFIDDVD